MTPFITGALSGIAGQHIYEEWIMPTIRRDDLNRPVVGDAPIGARPIERSGGISRGDILRPVENQPTFEPVLEPRTLPAPRSPIRRDGDRGLFTPGASAPIGTTPPSSATPPGLEAPIRRYPGNDPLSILADVMSSFFGAADQFNAEPQYSVVPQVLDKGGGGSSMFLILAILAAAGFGIYYFYFRN